MTTWKEILSSKVIVPRKFTENLLCIYTIFVKEQPMAEVESPSFFCNFHNTSKELENALLNKIMSFTLFE